MKLDPARTAAVHSLSPDVLVEHTDWMRRLVGYLVRDEAQVEDLVQDAWAVAMDNPPPEGLPLRAWLAGIVRRTVPAKGRGDARRRQREEDRALGRERSGQGTAPSVAELSACADEQRFLLEALGELPEGEKAVLLLRFYEDLPPREIAARLGVPVNTVRTRQRLGIERLRGRLAHRHDGNSSAWATALLPLVGVSGRGLRATGGLTASVGAGMAAGETMGFGLAGILRYLLLGAVVAGSLGAGWWWSKDQAPDLSRRSTPEEALVAVFGAGGGPAAPAAGGDLARATTAPRTTAERAGSSPPSFLGRVVDEWNQPIPGARLAERSEPRPNVSHGYSGRPDWVPAWRESGADGTFSVDAQGLDDELFVAAFHPDYAQVVEVTKMTPGQEAPIPMVRTATTTLQVELFREGDGQRAMNFSILAYQQQDPYGEGYVRQSILNEAGTTTSGVLTLEKRFAVDRPLRVHLMEAPGFGFFKDPAYASTLEVDAVEDGVTRVRLERSLDAPEVSGRYPVARGLVLEKRTGEPIPGVVLRTVEEFATGELNREEQPVLRQRFVATDEYGRFAIALPKGSTEASIRLTHPHRLPLEVVVSTDPLDSNEIHLGRRGALGGVILDGDGRPVPGAPLLVHVPIQRGGGSGTDSEHIFADREGRFELTDLLPGRTTVFVLSRPRGSDDNALTSASFRMKGGENRDVEIRIDRPERVRVKGDVSQGGTLLRSHVPIFLPMTDDGAWTMARAGKYGFDAGGLERGRYLVALVPAEDSELSGPVALLPGVEVTGLGAQRFSFQVPDAQLTGRVVPAGGSSPAGLRVIAIPRGLGGFAADLLSSAKALDSFGVPVDPMDGTFRLPHLSSGPHRLELWSDGSGPSLGRKSTREVTVSGSRRISDWIL